MSDNGSDSSGSGDSWTVPDASVGGADSGGGADSFTETTTQGWLSRVMGGFVAALIGLLLVPAAVVLLYWNEGRAVDAIRALNRGAASVVEVAADPVDAAANGKLVHLTGMARPGTAAADPVFGVTGDGLIRLRRTVEMFQWKQDSHSTSSNNLGGSKTTETTYTYEKAWSEQPIDSTPFKVQNGHRNPPMPVRSATFDGGETKIGAYKLDPSVMD